MIWTGCTLPLVAAIVSLVSPEISFHLLPPEHPRYGRSHEELVDHRGNHKKAINSQRTDISHTEGSGMQEEKLI